MDLLKKTPIVLFVVFVIWQTPYANDEDPLDQTEQPQESSAPNKEKALSGNNASSSAKQDTEEQSAGQADTVELKPLQLRERVRSHANIVLPQDI